MFVSCSFNRRIDLARIQQLQNKMDNFRQQIGGGAAESPNNSTAIPTPTDQSSFQFLTSSALHNLSRLQFSFSGPRFNLMSVNRSQTHSRSSRGSRERTGRRYDISLVVLDHVPGKIPQSSTFQHTTQSGLVNWLYIQTLTKNVVSKRC